MEIISNLCSYAVMLAMVVTPVLFIIWLIRLVIKKPHKRVGIASLISFVCFVVFILLGTFTSPATYCDHEYKLLKSEDALCEKDGFEEYHCDLCDSNKTDIINKLGHDMVDASRVEPTYDAAGEYVQACTRCDYTETEVLAMLAKPTEEPPPATPEPTVEPKQEATPKPSPETTTESAPIPTPVAKLGLDKAYPIVVTPEQLAAEIIDNSAEAAKKYNGKWVKIKGKITDVTDGGTMWGYYLYGKKVATGYEGLRIICWKDGDIYAGAMKGSTYTFLGCLREISTINATEIANCEIIKE